MGSLRGRPRRGRLPSELLSEKGFMAEGPLKGPGSHEISLLLMQLVKLNDELPLLLQGIRTIGCEADL